jgi:hypothetical protein
VGAKNLRQFAAAKKNVALVEGFGLTARRAHRRMKEVLCFCNWAVWARNLRKTLHHEVDMAAYLLLLVAVLSRVIPHAPWWSFTAVTGCLLYFGAKRPWREMLAPLAALITVDCYLTLFRYPGYSMHWGFSAFSWGWYLAAMVLGSVLLRKHVTLARGAAGAILGPTSFFLVSNFGAWFSNPFNTYPRTLAGLETCLWAGVPFYRNDLVATSLVLAVMFGVPALVRRTHAARAQEALAGK